jgi:hypothetical protein
VGFCGQASANPLKIALDMLRTLGRNLAFHLRVRIKDPQPLLSTAWLRARALHCLAHSPLVNARFILRSRYRAGSNPCEARDKTSLEFYQNIAATDYTLCVRGGGNFSKRFYETLAMGRIPLLLDTDCVLPFESEIDWDRFIVRVPVRQMRNLPRAVAEHFHALGQEEITQLKHECRRLWENWLTFGAFHRRLARTILQRNSTPKLTPSNAA